MVVFPGRVRQIASQLNFEVTILADRFGKHYSAEDEEEAKEGGSQVFVLADTVRDEADIMKLCIKRVDGIEEPVKLVSGMGFAVGAQTNKVFAWGVNYLIPE